MGIGGCEGTQEPLITWLEKWIERRFTFCEYLVFLIYQPRYVRNLWVTELTYWELLSRPEGQVSASLNQGFSNLSVQQIHQQGPLKHKMWACPGSFCFSRSGGGPRIFTPNNFPGDADAVGPGSTLGDPLPSISQAFEWSCKQLAIKPLLYQFVLSINRT